MRIVWCVSSLFIIACSPVQQTVDKVVDGDSLVLMGNELQEFELAYIDAPEREQPFGREAKAFLKEKVNSGLAHFVVTEDKKLEVTINGKSLNLIMVEEGYAWALPEISEPSRAKLYNDAQKMAVEHLSGLWGLGHGLIVSPWQWRHQGTEVINNKANFNRQQELKKAMNKQRLEYEKRMQQNAKAQQQAHSTSKEGNE